MLDATIWRLIAHHHNRDGALRWSLRNGRIAIGWGAIGDIQAQGSQSAEEIRDAIQHFYPELSNSSNGGFSLWNFYPIMKPGDLVILRGNKEHRVVELVGSYVFDRQNIPVEGGNYFHQRCVRFTPYDADVLWKQAGHMARDGGSIYRTLIRCERTLSANGL